ncbi:MAG: NAD(P)H-dependent oxidoreductase [Candidatus Lokiarchaeota archaeon]|nr:NAD(P)H-dependent oxidoreductase [Candidatus Lokiarchaeota archaeon]
MKKIIKILITTIPYISVILLEIFANVSNYNIEIFKPFNLIIGAVLLLNLITASLLKVNDYFTYGISVVAILGSISVFLFPSVGQIYLENIIAGLYLGLFVAAFLPPLFKLKPFTVSISEKNYSEAVVESKQFLKINLIINYIWAGLFAISIMGTVVKYSDNSVLQTLLSIVVPIILLVSIGIPVTKKLPTILMQKTSGEQLHFETIKDSLESMPHGLNKDLAQGVDVVIQYCLTGEDALDGYLIIKDSKCLFKYGIHPNPTTTIKADSKLWLGISNKEISQAKAYINKEYEVEGDMTILLKLHDLFGPTKKEKEKPKKEMKKPEIKKINSSYKSFEPGKIRKIVVFDGGPRNNKFSKTSFMVNNFIEGAKEAGANVEYFKLNDYNIHDCSGCYSCFTKAPGECIYKDDMTMLRKKYREADLVVFASPLYVFNVTGILKRFLDRLLPILKPYMVFNKQGSVYHPDRYPELGKQGFIVFSASGFPDLEDNFDGLRGMFNVLDTHSENMYMMGEFYMTAAETLVQPIGINRKNKIQIVCKKAGVQVVKEGKIDTELMQKVIYPGFSSEEFQEVSNYFWESLDGKAAYLKEAPKVLEQ